MRVAPFGARTIGGFIPRPHKAFGLCALGLMQVKASGLVQVFDLPHATCQPTTLFGTLDMYYYRMWTDDGKR